MWYEKQMTLIKMFSSNRTSSNGRINNDYDDYEEWANKQPDNTEEVPTYVRTIVDMGKEELIAYAKDMYGLTLKKNMTEGNMVKAIYECVNGTPERRIYKKKVKQDS